MLASECCTDLSPFTPPHYCSIAAPASPMRHHFTRLAKEGSEGAEAEMIEPLAEGMVLGLMPSPQVTSILE